MDNLSRKYFFGNGKKKQRPKTMQAIPKNNNYMGTNYASPKPANNAMSNNGMGNYPGIDCTAVVKAYKEATERAEEKFEYGNDQMKEAREEAQEAFDYLMESLEINKIGGEIMREATMELKESGCMYAPKYDTPECNQIKEQMKMAFDGYTCEKEESVQLIALALEKIEQADCYYAEGKEYVQKYLDCIYGCLPNNMMDNM